MLFSFAFALYFLALYVYGIKFSKKKKKKKKKIHDSCAWLMQAVFPLRIIIIIIT